MIPQKTNRKQVESRFNHNSLELSLTGEVIFKAFWPLGAGEALAISSMFSRLVKIKGKGKVEGILWIGGNV
jgi:hypothetical protein